MDVEKIRKFLSHRGEKVLVSSCLLGERCRYDGQSKEVPEIRRLASYFLLLPICPEFLGGLKTPRDPSEIVADKVLTVRGRDVTENYRNGAYWASAVARSQKVGLAILKDRSPSCGTTLIHDGTFSGGLVEGQGITAKRLEKEGLLVLNEDEGRALLALLEEEG